VALIADAICEASSSLAPARIGAGFGVLHGHSINRRRLERPVDPALGVVRIDNAGEKPLGMVVNFGCHAVVLGADNQLISADWPGSAAAQIEAELANEAVCLITQGGSADVNPMTGQAFSRLQDGQTIESGLDRYHGSKNETGTWNIYDRTGGKFEEVAELGAAVAGEVLRAARGVDTRGEVEGIWATRVTVNGAWRPNSPEFPLPAFSLEHLTERPKPSSDPTRIPLEVIGLGIEGPGVILVGMPGEVFAETAITMRRGLQTKGYRFPLTLSYANGWNAYLPPFEAFLEGGYETSWPLLLGIDPHIQERVWGAVQRIVEKAHSAT
jgi:hypothetical protein